MEKHNNHQDRITNTKKNTDKISENTFEVLKKNPIKEIENLAKTLFNTNSDWEKTWNSILYTIIKINNKDTLINIWEWDFDLEDFNQKDINKIDKYNRKTIEAKDYKSLKWFSRTPVPLFVVDKINSSLANEDQLEEMKNNPKAYLNNYSDIVVIKKKQAHLNSNTDIDFNNINILLEKTAKLKILNSIFETKIKNKDKSIFNKIMKKIQELDFKSFQKRFTNKIRNEKNHRSELFIQIKKILESIVLDTNDIQEIYNLVQSFNSNKNQFE